MTPRERDPSLPTLPENSEAKLSSDWITDEDAEDREEQGLFEQDNIDMVSAAAHSTAEAAYSLRNDGEDNTTVANNSQDDYTDPGPLYIQSDTSGESWELTWPIWHMLPRDERRRIATQHGMKSIGEFEEYMTLTRAVGESEGGVDGNRGVVQRAENNDSSGNNIDGRIENLSSELAVASLDPSASTWQPPFIAKIEEEVEDDDDDSCASTTLEKNSEPTITGEHATNSAEDFDLEDHMERIRLGGLPCSIPDEILHKAFAYLPIDDHANLALVSPYWSRFTRCESLYKTLCERIYLNQSKRKTLHVSKFRNSYRNMLELRPRVRTGGGLYVLKYQKVRKIERDMWTEIPVGAILESVYYRYMYFFEDGRVMYALTHATPVEMIPRFCKMLVHGYGSKDKWGVWGKYQIKKDIVRVWVAHEWTDVCFQLKVIPSNKVLYYDSGDKGVCTTMKLEDHLSSQSSNFDEDSPDLVRYDIPSQSEQSFFRFLRDRRL